MNFTSFDMKLQHSLIIAALGLLLFSCSDSEDILKESESESDILAEHFTIDFENLSDYSTNYPAHYPAGVQNETNTPATNPITPMGATLGRIIFYDKQMSINGSVSCASCHKQEIGFTDERKLSLGFDGVGETGAHSMRLANAAFYQGESMFWDKRAETLEDQVTEPIQDATEMGFDVSNGGFDALISRMNSIEYYPILFERTFGNTAITEEKVQLALAQFVRSIQSVNSRFDDGLASVSGNNGNSVNQDFSNFTDQENLGKRLFVSAPNAGGFGCQGCHQAPTFRLDQNSRSNGLDLDETVIFKSPSLKNVALDGAFMHDGRFSTLDEVVRHYSTGIQPGPALDRRLTANNGNPVRMNITENEIQAIVAFLHTLTDEEVITDERFSDPFLR